GAGMRSSSVRPRFSAGVLLRRSPARYRTEIPRSQTVVAELCRGLQIRPRRDFQDRGSIAGTLLRWYLCTARNARRSVRTTSLPWRGRRDAVQEKAILPRE